MSDVLARICAEKRRHVARQKEARPLAALEAALGEAPPVRGFHDRLAGKQAEGDFALIAEIKKASPSRGLIRADFDPPELARAYLEGGAACLSVLTDRPSFMGDESYLIAAQAAVPLPVLRKDFILEPYQVIESRLLGADCILLIMAALPDAEARMLHDLAVELGMDVLIESHDREELDRALRLPSPLIGINNRNLRTLEVTIGTCIDLAAAIPGDRLAIAESGLSRHEDLARCREAGIGAFLVGESLMRETDVAHATRRLLGRVP